MTGMYSDGSPICASVDDVVSFNALAKRLHGNNAAVIEIDASGPTNVLSGPVTRKPLIRFCRQKDVDCIELEGPGFRLNSLPVGESHPLVTSPDVLDSIKELLTNGVDNFIQVDVGGWSKSGPESLFFRDRSVVSGGEDYVDLFDFELSDIRIRYDKIGTEPIPTNSTFEQTRWIFEFRIMFELAE